jgi:hypothetical protein
MPHLLYCERMGLQYALNWKLGGPMATVDALEK